MTADAHALSVLHDPGESVASELLDRQRWTRLDVVLADARDRLPFYRRRFAAHGLTDAPIAGAEDFAVRVPITRKIDLVDETRRRHGVEIGIEAIDEPISNLVMTSGTLGFNTFGVLTHADLDGANLLGQLRELWMIGVRPGMRVLTMSPAWHILALVETAALTRIGACPIVPWGTYSPIFAGQVLDALRMHEPEHVLATLPVLVAVLEECARASLDPREVFASVRLVGCAGQALSAPMRRHLVEAMGLDALFERGGSSDGMFGGGECSAYRGHHIFADLHYVEIVDPWSGRPVPAGRRGNAVVTNLTGGRSVYLRFDTEDVAAIIPGSCPCGRTHPLIEFYGRRTDCVVLEDRIVAPVDVRDVTDRHPALRAAAVTLERTVDGRGVVVIVHTDAADAQVLDDAGAELQHRLDVPVEIVRGSTRTTGWKGQIMPSETR
jgi:phenylacetate-CoA ligase